MAPVAVSDFVCMGFLLYQQAPLPELFQYYLARLIPVEADAVGYAVFIYGRIFTEHVYPFEIVPVSYFKVIRIVCGSYFQCTGAEFGIHKRVANDLQLALHQGKYNGFSNVMLVPLVIRINSNSRISEHGFRPRRCHHETFIPILEGVANMIKEALFRLVVDLFVGKSCLTAGTPVDDVMTLVNEAFVEQANEHLPNSPGQSLVHGKTLTAPVAAGSQFLELIDDGGAVLLPPLPDLFYE